MPFSFRKSLESESFFCNDGIWKSSSCNFRMEQMVLSAVIFVIIFACPLEAGWATFQIYMPSTVTIIVYGSFLYLGEVWKTISCGFLLTYELLFLWFRMTTNCLVTNFILITPVIFVEFKRAVSIYLHAVYHNDNTWRTAWVPKFSLLQSVLNFYLEIDPYGWWKCCPWLAV